jgi:RND family efflux transporter MFP subunit
MNSMSFRAGYVTRTWALRATVALTLFTVACSKKKDEGTAAAAAAPQVMLIGPEAVAVVHAEQIRTGPALSGALAPMRSATIRAEMQASVLQTYAEAGQPVRQGQPLAQLDAQVIRDQVLSAKSAVQTAENTAELARRDVQRNETLAKAGAIADRAVEAARNQLLQAEFQVNNSKAQLANANKALEKASVESPFAGIVSARQVSAGDVVSPGTALYTVVDPASMQLEASVPAEQLSQVRVGMPVEFKVTGYPNRSFTGRITRVNPTADPTTRQVKITAALPNVGNTLVGGLFAEGRVATETKQAPMVQASAVDERGLRPSVVRLKNGKIEVVEVSIGIRDAAAETVEITAGLTPGDTVLLGAARGISPGTPVKVSSPSDVKR